MTNTSHLIFLVAVLFCGFSCSATPINSGQQYFVKREQQAGCSTGTFMGYLNKTCSASGPVLRGATDGKTWTEFTFTKVGKSAQDEDLVEIETYYPKSNQKPRCQGYIAPEKKDSCTIGTDLAAKVHIQAKKSYVWALSSLKGKKDTYTIRAYSRKSGCLKYLSAPPTCGENYLQLEAKDDGTGRQHWNIIPVKISPSSHPPPRKSPPPLSPLVEVPAVNYSIALTGYNKDSFGASQQTAFCDSILNATSYPHEWMRCVVSSVADVPFQGKLPGRRLMEASTVYVRGYTAFEFINGNETSQQQAQVAADELYTNMSSPTTLQTMFQSSFNSSTITPDAVDRDQVRVPENTLPLPPSSPSPSPSPSSPTPSSPSPSPTPSSPTLSPDFNTLPGGNGVITDPPVSSPVPDPTPTPTPTPTPVPVPSPPKYALVPNHNSASISSCVLSSDGTLLTSCTGTGGGIYLPESINIDTKTNIAYIFSGDANEVIACDVSIDGLLTGCITGLSLSPATCDSLHNGPIIADTSYIYFPCSDSDTITACQYNRKTFTNCASNAMPGTGPIAATLDITSNTMYVALSSVQKITICSLNGLTVSCNDMTPALTFNPYSIAVYTTGCSTYIFIGTAGNVYGCTVANVNELTCSATGGSFWTNRLPNKTITLNADNSLAYIPDRSSNTIIVCSVSGSTLSNCAVGASGFSAPSALSLFKFALPKYALVNSVGKTNDPFSSCILSTNGEFVSCVQTGGQSFDTPRSLSIDALTNIAYVYNGRLNYGGLNDVTACDVTAGGLFTTCNTGLSVLSGVCGDNIANSVINPTGKFIYFPCHNSDAIVACQYLGKTFVTCQSNSALGIGPISAYLDNTSNKMYVALDTDQKIVVCSVNGLVVTCTTTLATLAYAPASIGGFSVGSSTHIFIGTVNGPAEGCTVSGTTLTNCAPATGTVTWVGRVNIGTITLNADNSLAYIPDIGVNEFIGCSVSGPTLSNCDVATTNAAAGFINPFDGPTAAIIVAV